MVQHPGDLNLSMESLEIHAGSELRSKHLDDHAPPYDRVVGDEDLRHAAAAQLAAQAEPAAKAVLKLLSEVGQHDYPP